MLGAQGTMEVTFQEAENYTPAPCPGGVHSSHRELQAQVIRETHEKRSRVQEPQAAHRGIRQRREERDG